MWIQFFSRLLIIFIILNKFIVHTICPFSFILYWFSQLISLWTVIQTYATSFWNKEKNWPGLNILYFNNFVKFHSLKLCFFATVLVFRVGSDYEMKIRGYVQTYLKLFVVTYDIFWGVQWGQPLKKIFLFFPKSL